MTWSVIQQSAEASATSTAIAPAFGTPTVAGNTLFAVLINANGTTTWTLPTGWSKVVGIQNGGVSHTEIWWYPNNPGSITSVTCTSGVSANIKGGLVEVHTDVAGATVTVNAIGTGTAGATNACSATTTSAAASGDFVLMAAHEHLVTAAAVTWTTPTGYVDGPKDTASGGNHLYSAYELSAAAGTLTVTATSTVSTTSTSGWAAVVVTITASAASTLSLVGLASNLPAAGTSPILQPPIGSALFGAYPGGGNADPTAYEAQNMADRQLAVVTRYMPLDGASWPSTADKTLVTAGRYLYVDWSTRLTAGGFANWSDITAGTYDSVLTAQANYLGSWGQPIFVALTAEMDGTTWQNDSGNGHAGLDYPAYFRHVHDLVAPIAPNVIWCWVVTGAHNNSATAAMWPGDNYVDWIGFDQYDPTLAKGSPLATYQPFMNWLNAQSFGKGKPVGIFETGIDNTVSDASEAAWINKVPAALAQLGISMWLWFNSSGTLGNTAITPGSQAAQALAHIGGNPYYSLVGAFLNNADMGAPDYPTAVADWNTWTGNRLEIGHVYYAASSFPTSDSRLTYDANNGLGVIINLTPAYAPVSATDLANMDTMLSTWKAAGLNMVVSLWGEPFNAGLSAAQFIAMFKYYGPTVRKYAVLAYCSSALSAQNNNENSYWPGDDQVDVVLADIYCIRYDSGTRLDTVALLADNAVPPKPLGLGEWGSSTAVGGQTQAQFTTYIGYLQTYYVGRASAHKKNAWLDWFNSGTGTGNNAISSGTDYRVPLYDTFYDALAYTAFFLPVLSSAVIGAFGSFSITSTTVRTLTGTCPNTSQVSGLFTGVTTWSFAGTAPDSSTASGNFVAPALKPTLDIRFADSVASLLPFGKSQLRSYRPDGSDVRWLGSTGIVSGLTFSSSRPGGDDQMSLTLNTDASQRTPAIDPGRFVEVYRGASRVWYGKLDEPQPTPTGWTVNAYGSGAFGSDFVDVWSTWDLNDAVNQAITRGLKWINPGVRAGFLGQQVDSGSQTISEFLNSVITSPPQIWWIDRNSTLNVAAIPTTVTRLLIARVPPGRTVTDAVNTIYLKYVASDNGRGKTTYGLVSVSNSDLIRTHGEIEKYFDITGVGVLTAAQAQGIGNDLLSKYQRAPFSTAFTVSPGEYLNLGGVPVDLGSQQAGEVVRLLVVDSPYGGEVQLGPIQFMVGAYSYDEDSMTATVTPYMSYRTDLQAILTQITEKRGH